MKPVSPELLTLLNARQFFAADLWTITLSGGTVLRYCGGDADISANGFLYLAGGQVGPYFDRTDNKAMVHWQVGTDSDTLTVDVIPGSSQILGTPFLNAVREGIFDGAKVMLERAFMPTYGDTRRGVVRYFVGNVAEIDAGRSVATFQINSFIELLQLDWPRNIAQPKCMNNLGDSTCTATIPTSTGTVSGTPTAQAFTATLGGSFTSGVFDLGKVLFTSGAMSGFSATIKAAPLSGTTASISLLGFLPSAPAVGDTFTIYYGCNKSYTDSNGCPKFSNTAHFRGMPFVPQPSVAV